MEKEIKNEIQAQLRETDKKFIVLDLVFYGSSLNYDWGEGNYQPLKKITKWDGRKYILVSRYALRYSILHWANKLFPDKWKLAKSDILIAEEDGVARLKTPEESGKQKNQYYKEIFSEYPEYDLFGFMIAKKNENKAAITRTSPVKISHAISLTPYNLETHTIANLDVTKRAGGKGSNPVDIEEKQDFYIYNITIDVDKIGKFLKQEHGDNNIGDIILDEEKIKDRIINLIDTILNLKRDIKGRREDLSPWIVILGLYNDGRYETHLDKIRLETKTYYKIKRRFKKEGDIEIFENEIENSLIPNFFISLNQKENVKIFYREDLCNINGISLNNNIIVKNKNEIINIVKEFLDQKKCK